MRFSDLKYRTQRAIIIVAFSFIPLLLLLTFGYYPLVKMLQYSFHKWNGYSANMEFVGLDNYIQVFTDPEYFYVFRVSLYYFFATFVQIAIALYFATLLSFQVKLKNFFKGALFFPYLLNGVAIGFIFLYFYRPGGTLDALLTWFGLESVIQYWLREPAIINISLAATSVWRYMGFNFIIFLGAIQSIPRDIYEAADIDGADRWQQFCHIILPSIRRVVGLLVILSVSGAISVFEIPYVMTGGANRSATFVIQTVDTAFKYNKFGLASAMGIILLMIVVAVAVLQRSLIRDKSSGNMSSP